jgi:hypothetical protein
VNKSTILFSFVDESLEEYPSFQNCRCIDNYIVPHDHL